jgi:hypothetical protein
MTRGYKIYEGKKKLKPVLVILSFGKIIIQ